MGGNVKIGNENADRIDLDLVDRDDLVKELQLFMESFEATYGAKLEPSGSTRFLFNRNISTSELKIYKPSFGDIDFQIDKNKMPKKLKSTALGSFTYIGSKMTTNTLVTLWKFRDFNIQIDFEGVEFDGDQPTKWSQFSYSASWLDQMSDIKGVAHKYIFRALTARWLNDYPVRMKSGVKNKRTSIYAFSNKGLRKKLIETDYGEYIELKTNESTYIRDLELIFMILICSNCKFSETDEILMHSFHGILQLIQKYIPENEWVIIADAMAHLLWDRSAQEISSDLDEDMRVKMAIMKSMAANLWLDNRRWDELCNAYYAFKYPYGILQIN